MSTALGTARPDTPVGPDHPAESARPVDRVVPLLVGLVAALVYAIGLERPSPWRDEVATIDAVRRSPAGILRLGSHVDAVHTAYYLLAHGVADLDPGPVRVLDGRLVSLVAMAVAAGGTVVLGRRTDRRLTGVLAGLFVAVSPLASRYAQEARPFALAVAFAVLATVALLRALEASNRRRWAVYGLLLVALGAVEVLALLVVVVHALVVLTARDGDRRRRLIAWVLSAGVAVVVLGPLLVEVVRQRGQIGALATPSPAALVGFGGRAVGSTAGVGVLFVVAVVVVVRSVRRARGTGDGAALVPASGRSWVVPLVWGVGLPALVWLVSQADPLFRERYVLFCLPGIALLVGRVLARAPRAPAWAALVAVAVTGLPVQAAIRGPGGHDEDIRALDAAVAAQRRPGDVAAFSPRSITRVTQLDPAVWAGLPTATTAAGLTGSSRVLLVQQSAGRGLGVTNDGGVRQALAAGFRATTTTDVTGFRVTVYVRRATALR